MNDVKCVSCFQLRMAKYWVSCRAYSCCLLLLCHAYICHAFFYVICFFYICRPLLVTSST